MMKLKKEFEDWFLNLNRDFGEEELVQLRNCDQYFYTSTKALYDQFCTIAQQAEQIKELQEFAQTVLSRSDYGVDDIDGYQLQELAVKCGLFKMVTMDQPCNPDYCACASALGGDEFPVECYQDTDLLLPHQKESEL